MTGDSRLGRRSFLAGAGALTAGLAVPAPAASAASSPSRISDPFTLGVASGDPLPDGVVLWTRLAPDPLNAGGMPQRPFEVAWEVAADERFSRVVRHGVALARPEHAHSVRFDVRGLEPSRWYFYRFRLGGELSPVGRTLTAPARDAHPRRLRLAFASCQDFQDGFYTSHQHLSQEDLDLVVFLGDYIYESGVSSDSPRQHNSPEITTLADYRNRYALYKTDPDLQAAHAAFPWVVTFDDHEVDNDWSGDIPEDPEVESREQFLARRAAAFQAYVEHMPLRRRIQAHGPDIRIYRRLEFGDLASFNVLDTRQYRSLTEPCDDDTGPACPEVFDPDRTMLGDQQERWLLGGLGRSSARWNVIAQQVPMTRIDVGSDDQPEFKLDKWDAYPVARQRLLDFLAERRPSNPVVITGDLHDGWVADLKHNFDDPRSAIVASEFIGNSISSDGDGSEISEDGAAALPRNPHIHFHTNRRGYVRCELDANRWRSDIRVLPFVSSPGAPISTRVSFEVEDGRPGAQLA